MCNNHVFLFSILHLQNFVANECLQLRQKKVINNTLSKSSWNWPYHNLKKKQVLIEHYHFLTSQSSSWTSSLQPNFKLCQTELFYVKKINFFYQLHSSTFNIIILYKEVSSWHRYQKLFNKFHPFKRYTKYTINTCKPFRWQQQPLFYGWNPLLHSSDHFNSQSNPRSPASCLLSLILLDLKQNIHTAIISKVQRFHLPSSILIIWNHTIYTFIQKDDARF